MTKFWSFIDPPIYYLKFTCYFLIVSLALGVTVFVAIITQRLHDSRNALSGGHLLVVVGKVLGINVKVRKSSKVDVKENVIVAMNHQSALDMIVMSHILKILGNLAPVAQSLWLSIPPFGLAFYVSDGMLLDKKSKNTSRTLLNEKFAGLTLRKKNLIMFPEETRHDGNELLPFKKEAFHMSAQSNMKILPVVVQKYSFLNHGKKVFGRGEVKVKMLSPIEKQWFENVDDFTKRAYNLMNDEYQLMNQVIQ